MSAPTPTPAHGRAHRCTVCQHPSREVIDEHLVLKKWTQATAAKVAGVDRSSISRHVKNHVLPTVAAEVVIGSDLSVTTAVDEIDRLYRVLWASYLRADHDGDGRLALGYAKEIRQLLGLALRMGERLAQGGLRHLMEMSHQGMLERSKQIKAELREKFEQTRRGAEWTVKFFNTEQGQQIWENMERAREEHEQFVEEKAARIAASRSAAEQPRSRTRDELRRAWLED